MKVKIQLSFTDDTLDKEINKTLCFLENDQLYLSNNVDIIHMPFFKEHLPEFTEIVYFEHDRPLCSGCGCEMKDNGSREVKPNKLEGIRKKNNTSVQIAVKPK